MYVYFIQLLLRCLKYIRTLHCVRGSYILNRLSMEQPAVYPFHASLLMQWWCLWSSLLAGYVVCDVM